MADATNRWPRPWKALASALMDRLTRTSLVLSCSITAVALLGWIALGVVGLLNDEPLPAIGALAVVVLLGLVAAVMIIARRRYREK